LRKPISSNRSILILDKRLLPIDSAVRVDSNVLQTITRKKHTGVIALGNNHIIKITDQNPASVDGDGTRNLSKQSIKTAGQARSRCDLFGLVGA
jgi:hypothetical protein